MLRASERARFPSRSGPLVHRARPSAATCGRTCPAWKQTRSWTSRWSPRTTGRRPLFPRPLTPTRRPRRPSRRRRWPPPFPATPLFSAAWEEYREDGLSIRKATAGNLAHERSSLTLWLAIVGDRPLGDCARGDAAAFRRTVARLPKDYHRNKRWRGKTFAQMTQAADARDKDESRRIARIEIKTVNRHLPLSATPSCRPFDETHPSNTIRGESEIV
jgi:hypothetical protein